MGMQLRIGICADVHNDDKMPDCNERMQAFVTEMNRETVDFIIQLGDFSPPNKSKQDFFDVWNSFKGPRYHVLGNHDRDNHEKSENDGKRFDWDEVTAFYDKNGICPGRYYSFDFKGYHFVVLDSNEARTDKTWMGLYSNERYPCYIGPAQRKWLAEDLAATDLPTIVCSHDGIDREDENSGIYQALYTRYTLEQANEKAGWPKVQLCLSGHWHNDYYNVINGIHYVQINSMAFDGWVPEEYAMERYEHRIYEKYPLCKYTVPFTGPLWAVITFDDSGFIDIKGTKTSYLGPSLLEMGLAKEEWPYPCRPQISNRRIKVYSDKR